MKYKTFFGIILIINAGCLFENAKYISAFSDVNKLYKQITENNKISLILIYSESCPHCRRFEPEFIKLSERYNSLFDFYILSSKTNYNLKFKIRGYPTMFFYDGDKFIEHKGRNNFETISYILENDYSKKCKEIDLDYLNKINSELKEKDEKYEQNYIIGYFPNENIISNRQGNYELQKLIIEKTFDSFLNNTNQIISLIDNCYYIRNLNNNEKNQDTFGEFEEGTVLVFSENKGMNKFIEYQNIFSSNQDQDKEYYNKRIKDIGELYKKFLNEKIIDHYIDITDSKMANKLKMFVKRNVLLFLYKNDEEKNDFIKKINLLIGITKNDKYPLFDYVLFKFGCNLYSLSYYIRETGIYYVDKDLNKISKQIDLNVIINMINTQNDYEYNPEDFLKEEKIDIKNNTDNKTNNISEQNNEETYYEKLRENIIEKQLMNYLNNKKNDSLIYYKQANSVTCFLICLIFYTLIFDTIYQIFSPGKSIFHIFNDCILFIKVSFCDYDEEEDINNSILKEQNKIDIKIDDNNDEASHIIKVNSK